MAGYFGLNYESINFFHPLPYAPNPPLINNDHSLKEPNIVSCCSYGYKAAQFHFHWGRTNMLGSEHSVDMEFYPLEVSVGKSKNLRPEGGCWGLFQNNY